MRIDYFSHYFTVRDLSERERASVYRATRTHLFYGERELIDGRWVINPATAKTYAFSPFDKSFFRYHINFLPTFLKTLEEDRIDMVKVEHHHHEMTPEQAYPVVWEKKPNDDEDREYQELIDANLHSEGSNKVVNLQPGAGKTKITMNFIAKFGVRTQAVMSAKYLSQWAEEISDYFYTDRNDIIIIQGASSLRAMMEMHLDGELEAKIILMSMETMGSYLKGVEQGTVMEGYFPISPDDYFRELGIGVNVIDEGHQNPHRTCRLFCHMNVLKSITLSATLNTKNTFLNKMFEMMYPKDIRDTGGYSNVYIGTQCVHYSLKRPGRLRYTGWKGSYNHTKFEESLLKHSNKAELLNYMAMLRHYVQTLYIDTRKEGQKAIIFFSTKNMCTYARNYFAKEFPQMTTVRYIGEDKREVMDGADFIVSTVLSAGTAVDIKNLIVNYLTINIDSQISNEQTLGRTRPVKNEPGRTPLFVWFCCDSIDKHRSYTANKKNFLKEKVKYIEDVRSPVQV